MQHIAYYQSPVGTFKLTGKDGYVVSLQLYEGEVTHSGILPEYLNTAMTELDAYFKGALTQFTVPVHPQAAPAFTQSVWQALRDIPYGKSASYAEVAKNIGNAKAARAVGNACNRNPLPLIVPCHRVVGSKGAMTGFALGIPMKEWLLAHERSVAEAA